MTRRRAILHVGSPRTGMTTIQTLLHRRRLALLDVGVLYPTLTPASASVPHINHQHLGETFDGRRPRRERRELIDALDEQFVATAADVVILSYERLCFLPRWSRAPAALKDLFERRGFALELLSTVRPQAGAVQSQYAWRCQFLREPRPFREAFHRDLGERRLAPAASVGPWLGAAGGRVTAVPLRDARSSEPLATRVFSALGLGSRVAPLLTAADLVQVENGSLNAAALEVCRRLRAVGIVPRDNAVARCIVDEVEAEVRRRGLDGPQFQGLDAEMIERAEMRFAEVNERFARQVWGEAWARRVAPDRSGPITDIVARADPLLAKTEDVLAEIVEDMRTRLGHADRHRGRGLHRLFLGGYGGD